jgi:hypothetical protein
LTRKAARVIGVQITPNCGGFAPERKLQTAVGGGV